MQSLHLWFDEIKRKSLTYELTQSKHDEALFFKEELYVTLYVNDIKTFVSDAQSIDHFSQHLKSNYEMIDQDVQWYLSMKISRVNDSILLTQVKYIRNLSSNHEMKECSFVSISMIEIKLKKVVFHLCMRSKRAQEFSNVVRKVNAFDDANSFWYNIRCVLIDSIYDQFSNRSLNRIEANSSLFTEHERARNMLLFNETSQHRSLIRFQLRRESRWLQIDQRSDDTHDRRINNLKIVQADISCSIEHWDRIRQSDVDVHSDHVNQKRVNWDRH
jgi:hypothetical protein